MSDATTTPLAVARWAELEEAGRERVMQRGLGDIFDPALRESIEALVADVRDHGDDAVVRALARFDGCKVPAERLRVSPDEIEAAGRAVNERLRAALAEGIASVRAFNEHLTAEREWRVELQPGLVVGEKATPIADAGLFVPCGKGSYPSVLVQIGTPAVVAGVPELTVIVPPMPDSNGKVDPAVLWVASELGIERVFRANGPAGVAALACGTESFPRVRKVVGPGSPAVQLAQIECQRWGCHTQMLLGPSESIVIADESADVRLLAADLLNEAEHGPDSAVTLITDAPGLLDPLQLEIAAQLAELPEPRREWAASSLSERGGALIAADLEEAVEITNLYAPEHLQIVVRDEEAVVAEIEHAGEILLGQSTPIAAANYVLGVPASLPTGGFARVTGGITAQTFLKPTSIAKASAAALERLATAAEALAEHEGFPAHAAAVRMRRA